MNAMSKNLFIRDDRAKGSWRHPLLILYSGKEGSSRF